MNRNINIRIAFLLVLFVFSFDSFGANILLPSSPVGGTVYILPGVYGAAGDNFFLSNTFNAPNGSASAGSAVTISRPGTFTLTQSGIINQAVGGGAGVGSLRAIVLAKAGATINNLGTINGMSNTATENTFGMVANSVQSGLPTQSSYANNFGVITMEGGSTDGMHAAGILSARSYVINYGTINVSDRATGVSSWIEGMSATGNGVGINETMGVINANSKSGSRGSAGMFGGFNQTGFDGTDAFSAADPQMINKGTIISSGDSHGFYYWGDFKTFQRNEAIVNITGRGHGAYFDNSGTAGAGSGFENSALGNITTNSDNSYGVYLRLNNNIYANNYGVIQTLGNRSHGIVAYSAGSFATNYGIIRTNAGSSAGIFYNTNALNDVNFKWNLGNIEVNGISSFGIATPQSFFRNDGTIFVNGANSYGMLAGGSYAIAPDGTIPNNTYLGGLTPLSANQGPAQIAVNYGVINATAALTVGMGAQGINSIAFNAQNKIINAAGSGVGMLARTGGILQNLGSINVGANSVGIQTDISSVAYNFGLINFTAQNGSLIGNIMNDGVLYYDAGNGGANYAVQGTLANSGLIYLGGTPGNALTITGDYIGKQGYVGLNTILNGDNSPSNLLIIDGGSATGSSGLIILNTTGVGALTLGNGILVVNTINNGTTDANAFYLINPVVAGPYEYFLVRGAKDGSKEENWYLFNTFDNPSYNPPISLNRDIPLGNNIPFYRREVSLAAAIPSMSLLYDQFILSTLHQRIGEQEQIIGNFPDEDKNGVWIRSLNQKGTFNNNGIYLSGPSFDYLFNAFQMGMNIYRNIHENESSTLAGILGSYGKEHGNVDHLNIINAGINDFDAWTLGGYFTHYHPKGWYIDSVIFASHHQVDANSNRGLPSILARGFGTIESIEGGYNIALPHGFGLEPQAQLALEQLSINNSNSRREAIIGFQSTNSAIGRLGARLTRTWEISSFMPNNITGWLFGSIWRQFQGNSQTSFASLMGDIPFNSELKGTWHQIGFGLNAAVNKTISIYGTGSYASYWNDHGHSVGGMIGIRVNL